jgi:DMSO/TMAO reductase YedYZ molybdopterin-dependent catalytic subunit
MDRRKFISIVGGAGVGILLPYALHRYLALGTSAGRIGVKDFLKDGAQAALRAITPAGDLYVMSSHGNPSVNVANWSLVIDGLVENPLRFNYDEIRRLPPYQTYLTLECISNSIGGRYIGNAQWRGTLLRPLLDRARVKANAVYAVLYAAEGYTTGHSVARILRPENFLACEMNGEPLTREHGFPLRIFLPGKYGMKMPKWLTRIELVDKEYLGYWEHQGWSNAAERQLRAVVDDPHEAARISGASFVITGYAVADASGVSRVEISTDNGRIWQPVEIFSNPLPHQVWAFWKYVWVNPPKGKHTLEVRAIDGGGRAQTAERSGEWPAGATGYHTLTLEVL